MKSAKKQVKEEEPEPISEEVARQGAKMRKSEARKL
jgi:hypothetical protein